MDDHAEELPNRHTLRYPGFDYRHPGAYFVTLCTHLRRSLFGHVQNGAMLRNACGQAAYDCWQAIPGHIPHVGLDYFVVMPNHLHGILLLNSGTGTACCAPMATRGCFGAMIAGSLAVIVRSYKSAVTSRIRSLAKDTSLIVWQRNYYEHILRNERELAEVRTYIDRNPLQWSFDRENPETSAADDDLPWEDSP